MMFYFSTFLYTIVLYDHFHVHCVLKIKLFLPQTVSLLYLLQTLLTCFFVIFNIVRKKCDLLWFFNIALVNENNSLSNMAHTI